MFKKLRGFTLIEVLIVVAIIGMLATALFFSMRKQRSRAEDAHVKSDLEALKIAFEDYYNDSNCYPPQTWFDGPEDCGSSNLRPYLNQIPCDPKTELPYTLEYVPTQCKGFRLYANLQNIDDPEVQALGDPSGSNLGNYGVSSGNTTVKVALPSPDSAVQHTYYYCQAAGNCTSYDPNVKTCSPSFTDQPNCNPYCTGPSTCTNN